MTSPPPDFDASRRPRRGDKVVSAPYSPHDVAGVVQRISGDRLVVGTAAHGNLTLPLARFTWKPHARHWVCWPAALTRRIADLDRADADHARARYGIRPCLGDDIVADGARGWIARLITAGVKSDTPGVDVVFSVLKSVEVSLPGRPRLVVSAAALIYDSSARVWIAG